MENKNDKKPDKNNDNSEKNLEKKVRILSSELSSIEKKNKLLSKNIDLDCSACNCSNGLIFVSECTF